MSDRDPALPTRRARRLREAGDAPASGATESGAPDARSKARDQRADTGTATATSAAVAASAGSTSTAVGAGPRALAWLDESLVTREPAAAVAPAGDLVAAWPRRRARRGSVAVPLCTLGVLALGYVGAMLLWPLNAVAPTVTAASVEIAPAPAAALSWPAEGAAAVNVVGMGSPIASTTEQLPMASVTKVISALVVLDKLPLAPGEQGPEYEFRSQSVWNYLRSGESALPVPVGGVLSEYQLLEGTMIGSAGNYIDRLAIEVSGSERRFAADANDWLAANGLSGITVTDPSGIGGTNTAAPGALLALAEKAMAQPVLAEIVGKQQVELPEAGVVENTNAMLGEPGVLGIKTGMLAERYNVLLAKDITVGETTLRVYASVLGQPDGETRWATARSLFAETEAQLQPTTAVAEGTVLGTVSTVWGEEAEVVAAADAPLILFNGIGGTAAMDLELGDERTAGAAAGTLTVQGPVDTATVDAELAEELAGPSPWWRLTHPLELLGLR